MRNQRNKNSPPNADLVQYFIDTAYDIVKAVYDNLDLVIAVGEAIENGELDEFLSAADIDTLAKLNAFVLDAQLASEAYVNATVDAAVVDVYKHKGGYDANTNTPDLTTSPNSIETAWTYQVTVAGTFFTAVVDVGDQITANQDDPSLETHWTILNRNIDETAFATAEQGAKADTASQPADNISTFTNDLNYADDQTAQEIVDAFTTIIPAVSQAEAEAGTETLLRQWSPLRIAQAIAALVTADVEEAPEDGSPYSRQDAGWVPAAAGGGVEFNHQTGIAYTVQESDNGKIITYNNPVSIFVDIPGTLSVGHECTHVQIGAGVPQINVDVDTINGDALGVQPLSRYSSGIYMTQYEEGKYLAFGDYEPAPLGGVDLLTGLFAFYDMDASNEGAYSNIISSHGTHDISWNPNNGYGSGVGHLDNTVINRVNATNYRAEIQFGNAPYNTTALANAAWSPQADFTYSAWLLLDDTDQNRAFFSNYERSINAGWFARVNTDNTVEVFVATAVTDSFESVATLDTMTTSTYFMVTIKYVYATKTISIKLNNGAWQNFVLTNEIKKNTSTTNSASLLMARDSSTGQSDPWNGEHDQWAFWNKALIDNEVSAIWNSGVGLRYAELY